MEQAGDTAKTDTETKAAADGTTKIFTAEDSPRPEVSAATVGRMLGLATTADFRLLEGKIDLILTKITTFAVRMEKLQTTLSSMPNGSDLERIDVQLGMVRNLLRDVGAHLGCASTGEKGPTSGAEKKPKASVSAKAGEEKQSEE